MAYGTLPGQVGAGMQDFWRNIQPGIQNFLGGMGGMNQAAPPPRPAPVAPPAGGAGTPMPGGAYGGAASAPPFSSPNPGLPGVPYQSGGPSPAAATGFTGAGPAQTPGSTGVNLNPASDYTNPTSALYAILKQKGVNTASSDPRIAGLLQHAQDLVTQNLYPMFASGQLNPMDMAGIGSFLSDVVQRAITNQPVFYGAGAGASMLQQLMGAAAGGQNSQGPEGLRFLASVMDNPQAAAAMGSSMMYGGAIPSAVANVLGKPLAQAPTDWNILNATMPGGMPLPGTQGYMNLLQRYLAGQFGNLGQPGAAGQ